MKKCPFCSAEILDEAEFCLYCMKQLTPRTSGEIPKKKSYLWICITCVLSALLFCVIILLLVKFAPNDNNDIMSGELSETTSYNTQSNDNFSKDTVISNNSVIGSNIANTEINSSNNSELPDSKTENTTTSTPLTEDPPNNVSSSLPSGSSSTDSNLSSDNSTQQPSSLPSSDEETSSKPVQIWSIKEVDGGVEIIGIENHNAIGDYEIPSQIDGKNVIGIGYRAFYYEEKIKTITLPDTLKYIDEQAFAYCSSITKIVIPASVTEIRNNAFVPCKNLSDIYIKSTDAKIATYAFSSMYQRDVSLTIHAPIGVIDALSAKISWDAEYEEWNE